MSWCIINRLLWGAIALMAVLLVILGRLPIDVLPETGMLQPITVPATSANAQTSLQGFDIHVPEWNIFDRDGEVWMVEMPSVELPNGEPALIVKTAKLRVIQGIIRLPGYEGLLTERGLVEVGGTYEGAKVKSIADGKVVFNSIEGDEIVPVEAERLQRRKDFIHYGFPFIDAEMR